MSKQESNSTFANDVGLVNKRVVAQAASASIRSFTPEADPYNNERARRSLEAARRENQVASPKNPR
jgi:hypothetical protein